MAQNQNNILLAPLLLAMSAMAGFMMANSAWSEHYFNLLNTKMMLGVGSYSIIHKSLLLLINDGLMAIFFLFVGLELKREVVVGELSKPDKAILPIAGAIGGMLIPALIYIALNTSGEASQGWGIPMATDIAFALGVLAVLGSRVPTYLKVLLAAVAIVDDLGAILIIALFYTSHIDLTSLGLALACFAALIALNRAGVMKLSLYMLVGTPLWYFMLKSGVHATIAGVALATTIPLAPRHKSRATLISDIFEKKASKLDSPAVFLEKSLVPWVSFAIIPIFAFANAGVAVDSFQLGSVALGIILGLCVGKPLGVFGLSWLVSKLGFASLPPGVHWRHVMGIAFLAGIGFTMSLFINSLAFTDVNLMSEAKLAIMIGSLICGFVGSFVLLTSKQ